MKHLTKYLQRTTSSTNFIPEIDGLRFYAIITVVIYHLNTTLSRQIGLEDLGLSLLGGKDLLGSPAWWIVRLDLGVKVFFSISGMVLALPFLKQYISNGPKIQLSDYFYRRLTRLEPPFVVSLLFFLCVHVLILDERLTDMIPHLVASLLYIHVIIFGYPSPINPVTWSLETEAQFYILVPLYFTILFINRSKVWLILVLLLSFSTSIFLKYHLVLQGLSQLSSSVIVFFTNFLTGIIAAWVYLKYTNFLSRKQYMWDILGFVAIIGQFYFYKPQYQYINNILFNVFVLLMILATFKGIFINWIFTRPLVYIVGGMCYSIYLLHYAFLHLVIPYTQKISTGVYGIDLIIQAAICIPLTILISGIFYILIERPCMNKLWPKNLAVFIQKIKA